MKKLLFVVCSLVALFVPPAFSDTKIYYIAADEIEWDFAPSGIDQITGQPFSEYQQYWTEPGPYTLGTKAKKAVYHEYTDSSFRTMKTRSQEWEHLGILGPLIRAEVGDTIQIEFKNNTNMPTSMHPHGVFYGKDSEGAPYQDGTSGSDKRDDGVPPGGSHTYIWEVPERAGPVEGGPSSAFWMYHSHASEVGDVNAGLFGPMIITARGQSKADGSPIDIDREFVITFYEFLEVESRYIGENINTYMSSPEDVSIGRDVFGAPILMSPDPDRPAQFILRETLNGYSYGHIPTPTMYTDEKVRWYVMGSTNFEVHAPHWHGNTFKWRNMYADTIPLLTMGMEILDMEPDAPGIWLFHCHVGGHFEAGMSGLYEIKDRQQVSQITQ